MALHGNMLLAPAGGYSGYSIDNSMVLDKASSQKLTFTPSSNGSQRQMTWSFWVKRHEVTTDDVIFGTADLQILIYFDTSERLNVYYNGTNRLVTTRVFRDVGSFYHIVVSVDTDNATADSRTRLWVNGVEETAFDIRNNPAINTDVNINQTSDTHEIGYYNTIYADLTIAEFHYLDGTAVTDPNDFGEFYNGTQWRPIQTSGLTYGTNGFYLPFTQDTPNLGTDYSGNGNDWTENGSPVQSSDSPTKNYSTLNPLAAHPSGTLSKGNTKWDSGGSGTGRSVISTISLDSGKWYVEAQGTAGAGLEFGFVDVQEVYDIATSSWFQSNQLTYIRVQDNNDDLFIEDGGSLTTYTAELTAGNPGLNTPIGFVLNLDDDEIRLIDANGITSTARSIPSGITWVFVMSGNGDDGEVFFREEGWTHTPPEGYKAISAVNLPDPTITTPGEHFNVLEYSGTGASQSITGAGFQPDKVWAKRTDSAQSHRLADAIRGSAVLFTDTSAAEDTTAGISFDSDGFSWTNSDGSNANDSGGSYVSWLWKGGNGTSSNSDGSITSTVSANADAGFSIFTYSGNSTSGATVAHGLGQVPEMFFIKARTFAEATQVYHASQGATHRGELSSSAAFAALSNRWNNTDPTSTLITLGNHNSVNTSYDYVGFAFASIPGYSKVFSYTGNGSADGPFVYCGFKPRWILTKRNGSSGWAIIDTERSPYNIANASLRAETSAAEASDGAKDILCNGFKLRNIGAEDNSSGNTYIGIAFAENPFGGSNLPLGLAQ